MVCEVHGAPIEHANVRPHVPCGAIPTLGDERAEGRAEGVEAGVPGGSARYEDLDADGGGVQATKDLGPGLEDDEGYVRWVTS